MTVSLSIGATELACGVVCPSVPVVPLARYGADVRLYSERASAYRAGSSLTKTGLLTEGKGLAACRADMPDILGLGVAFTPCGCSR